MKTPNMKLVVAALLSLPFCAAAQNELPDFTAGARMAEHYPDQPVEESYPGYEPVYMEVDINSPADEWGVPEDWIPLAADGRLFYVPRPIHLSERLGRDRNRSESGGAN